MIKGIGVDIVDVPRIQKIIERNTVDFLYRAFTQFEIEFCNERKNSYKHYAVRLAVKEAMFKALGMGWRSGLAWNDIEYAQPNRGKPFIITYGKIKHKLIEMEITSINVSSSFNSAHATAIIILEG
ncbi:MAG: holo-ACP synthase [Candidatus Hodarchaeota archaeon]